MLYKIENDLEKISAGIRIYNGYIVVYSDSEFKWLRANDYDVTWSKVGSIVAHGAKNGGSYIVYLR